MIGTPIVGTLWYVQWSHVKLPPLVEGSGGTTSGECYLVSADPSGSDLFEVAVFAVLNGKAQKEHEFALVHSKRLCEVKGTVISVGGKN